MATKKQDTETQSAGEASAETQSAENQAADDDKPVTGQTARVAARQSMTAAQAEAAGLDPTPYGKAK